MSAPRPTGVIFGSYLTGSVTIDGPYGVRPNVTCAWQASIYNPESLPVAVQWFVDGQYVGGGGTLNYQNSGHSFTLFVKAWFIDGNELELATDSRNVDVSSSYPVNCYGI